MTRLETSEGEVLLPMTNNFWMTYNPETGEVYTQYADGTKSGCGLVPEDYEHAEALEITPQQHRLQHELAHHIVGGQLPTTKAEGCDIIWRDAHGFSQQQPVAAVQEFLYTTVQYYSRGKTYNDNHGLVYLRWLGLDPEELAAVLNHCMNVATRGGEE